MSTKKQISLQSLSEEDRKALLEEALEAEKKKQDGIKQQRKDYKNLVNETVPDLFAELVATAEHLGEVKKKVYDTLRTLVDMKSEVYGRDTEQFSHSFTTDGGVTLIIGNRQNDNWDDTVNVGIKKVHDFLESLGKDDNSKKLVKTILQLLAKDKTGNLKASRVLQLKKLSEDINDPEFTDAINIIQDAYKPVKTKEFVTCRYTKNDGDKADLPLDISAVDFGFKFHEEAQAQTN